MEFCAVLDYTQMLVFNKLEKSFRETFPRFVQCSGNGGEKVCLMIVPSLCELMKLNVNQLLKKLYSGCHYSSLNVSLVSCQDMTLHANH